MFRNTVHVNSPRGPAGFHRPLAFWIRYTVFSPRGRPGGKVLEALRG